MMMPPDPQSAALQSAVAGATAPGPEASAPQGASGGDPLQMAIQLLQGGDILGAIQILLPLVGAGGSAPEPEGDEGGQPPR